ncbi:MAG: hypothetical protein FJ218_05585 [Ignavibacteria bacterium]|nr:hypothetical protein [Ignavibacteria bacterium]
MLTDKQKLDYLGTSFRFGRMMVGGILLQIFPMMTLRADYERQIIFPRLSFWKFTGSYAVEMIGEEMLDSFVKEIVRSSPNTGPIVNFILKNGYAYAFYELRKEKMHLALYQYGTLNVQFIQSRNDVHVLVFLFVHFSYLLPAFFFNTTPRN